MSKKGEIKKAIAETEGEIVALEQKRARSQTALMTAILKRVKPNPDDEEYFRVFSDLIDERRATLRQLNAELEELRGKKN